MQPSIDSLVLVFSGLFGISFKPQPLPALFSVQRLTFTLFLLQSFWSPLRAVTSAFILALLRLHTHCLLL